MPRTEEQNEAIRAATRDKIQAAAISLFTRKGFATTSVQDIARAAGISTGLMYRHYRTKEDLFAAIVTMAADGLDAVIDTFGSDAPATSLITGFVREYLGDIEDGGTALDFYLLLFQAVLFNPNDPRIAYLLDRQEALLQATVRLIKRGQRAGEFRSGSPTAMADCLFAGLSGLALAKASRRERFNAPKAELLTAFLIKETTR